MQKTNRSLERGLILLRQLELKGPATLSSLARHGELPKATASRLLLTLVEEGWVYRRLNDGLFVATLPQAAPAQEPDRGQIAKRALPCLIDLTEVTGLAADLVWVMGEGVLEVIESTRNAQAGGVDPKVAGFRPSLVFSAPGRALLAAFDAETRARHLAHVARTDSPAERLAVTRGQLAAELTLTKKRGYGQRAPGYWPQSSDYGQEPMDIAVAIGTLGCLSLVWPAHEHEASAIAAANLGLMRETARTIARTLKI